MGEMTEYRLKGVWLTRDIVIIQLVPKRAQIFPHPTDKRIGNVLLSQKTTKD